MFIPRILFAPLSLILSLFVWLCGAVLFRFVFALGAGLLFLPAFAVTSTRKERHHPPCAGVSDQVRWDFRCHSVAVQGLGTRREPAMKTSFS